MSSALTTSLSGMRSTQMLLDVTANNLANSDTIGFKSSRVMFSEELVNMISSAQSPRGNLGGINPLQLGQGALTASIAVQFQQGQINPTGRDLDLAIEGAGMFRLQTGADTYAYTRIGSMGFDAGIDGGASRLADLTTGHLVMSANNTPITTMQTLAATPTARIGVQGNLPPDGTPLQGEQLSGLFPLSRSDGGQVTGRSLLRDLTLRQGGPAATTLHIAGTQPDGTPFTAASMPLAADATVDDLVNGLNTVFNPGGERFANTQFDNGGLVITPNKPGKLLSVFFGETAPPAGASVQALGQWNTGLASDVYRWDRVRMVPESVGIEMRPIAVDGATHALNGRFYQSGTNPDGTRTYDLVLAPPADGTLVNDRLSGFTFDVAGRLTALPQGNLQVAWAGGAVSTITLDAAASSLTSVVDSGAVDVIDLDGTTTGTLSGVNIGADGVVRGRYSNSRIVDMLDAGGNRQVIGLSVFRNPNGLLSIGGGLWSPSGNSGGAQDIDPNTLGSSLQVGALEGANVDVAEEFTRLIIANRSFQSNSRSFQTADKMMEEANGLIR